MRSPCSRRIRASAGTATPSRWPRPAARSRSTPASWSTTSTPTPCSPDCSPISACRPQPTTMSFSASIADGSLEYGGGSLKALLAQRTQPAAAGLPAHAAGHRALQPHRAGATCEQPGERRPDPRRVPRPARLRPQPRRVVSAADGGRDLVGAGRPHAGLPRPQLPELLRQSRPAQHPGPSRLAHRGRRLARVCPAAWWPSSGHASGSPRRSRSVRRWPWGVEVDGRPRPVAAASIRSCWPAMPTRPCACSRTRRRASARSSAASATSPTAPSCTATPR